MQTTTRSAKWMHVARTMLLGLVLALGIAFAGGAPDLAWLGFAAAAIRLVADLGTHLPFGLVEGLRGRPRRPRLRPAPHFPPPTSGARPRVLGAVGDLTRATYATR